MILSPGFIEIDGIILGIEFWKGIFKYSAFEIDSKTVRIVMTDLRHGNRITTEKQLISYTSKQFCDEITRLSSKYD